MLSLEGSFTTDFMRVLSLDVVSRQPDLYSVKRSILTPPHIRELPHCLPHGAESVWAFPSLFHVYASFSALVEPPHSRRLSGCFPGRRSHLRPARPRQLPYHLTQMSTDCWLSRTQRTTRTMHVAICSECFDVDEYATLFEFHPCLRFSHE